MAIRPDRFAQLLTEGIYVIKRLEHKNIGVIQDELGYAIGRNGGTSIDYWRKGYVPAKHTETIQLAKEMVRRGNLGREWVHLLLESAGVNYTGTLEAQFVDDYQVDLILPWANYLPSKPYKELIGRTALLDEIIRALDDPNGRWVVAIDGVGGIGKTALTHEVINQCMEQRIFDSVVWISASKGKGSGTEESETSGLTFESVLNSIGIQLGDRDIHQTRREDKIARVRALLSFQRALVVLDNLETADEPQNDIVLQIEKLMNPSKALLTSRQRFEGNLYAIHLVGLKNTDAYLFVRHEASEKRVKRMFGADNEELETIVQATSGSPLALKLIVGQLSHLPTDAILNRLQNVHLLEEAFVDDDYSRFYQFIFMPSWQLIPVDSKNLLVSMVHFPTGSGGTFEAVKAASGLSSNILAKNINTLWKFSFIEIGESTDLNQIRYYLHSLTQYFVLSDIVQEL